MQIAVAGPGEGVGDETVAELVGRGLGSRRVVLICGGLGGVMEAACRGAKEAGGLTVGILPGLDPSDANPYVDVVIATGLGEARNALVVNAADALIAVGRGYGTLSEIGLALRAGKRVVGLETWDVEGLEPVDSPDAAVETVLGDLNT